MKGAGRGYIIVYTCAQCARKWRRGKGKNKNVQMETGNIIEKLAICSGDKSIALMRNVNLRFCSSSPKLTFRIREGSPLELL